MKKTILYTSVAAIALASCTKTQFSSQTYSPGSANFTKMVAVGNSLTQGYMDGGLYAYGQSNSYPSIIAQQVKLAVPSMVFNQPTVTGNGSGYIHLVYLNGQLTPIEPGDDSTAGSNPCDADASWATWGTSLQVNSYNNLGEAGILLTNCVALNSTQAIINNVLTGYQDIAALGGTVGNPYGRFLNYGSALVANPTNYIDLIRSSKATFFTCWLGNNDVLGYATSGGVVTDVSTPLGTIAENEITPPAVFAQKYDSVLLAFYNMGAQGVCATIPDVTTIPFFNTVPSYVMVNGGKQYLWITTSAGVRQATDGDYIILPEYNAVVAGQGVYQSNPVPNNMVLDATEVDSVEIATNAYNASIKSLAAQYNFALVDMHAYLTTLSSSITVDGMTMTRQFVQGGAFGLDGVHPTAIGYALIANQFIATINAKYGATIPPVAVSNYRGCLFPSY